MTGRRAAGVPRAGGLVVRPLVPERWADLEALFGERGACGGCWCMWWRQTRSEFARRKGEANKTALRALVGSGTVPGLLGYVGGRPVAWCALQPREAYSTLRRSRVLAPVDDRPVWSVPCFFVARPYRGQGLTVALLREAARYAARQGARIVEGYPVEPRKGRLPDAFAWTGLVSAFRAAGFAEAARRSPGRPVMRWAARRA